MRAAFALCFLSVFAPAADSPPAGVAQTLSRQIRQLGLDPDFCFRVRDLRFARDEIKLYFNDGYLIFGKPVNGLRISAVFAADIDGGDAELLLMPPFARERRSLAAFANSPNLAEHFKIAAMVFTDDTAAELLAAVQAAGAKKSEEMGNLIAGKWSTVVNSLLSSFEVRLVEDLLSPRRAQRGFFFSAVNGNTAGNFDVVHDPMARHDILLGQIAYREERRFYDIWTNFESRTARMGKRRPEEEEIRIENVRIDANVGADLALKCVTRMRVTPKAAQRILPFELSQRMNITAVQVDGQPADSFSPESLRANLLRGTENQVVLVSTGKEFESGKALEVEFHHEGNVILPAGDRVFFVGARSNWYPNRGRQFADYDVTFHYPKDLSLVGSGDLVSEIVEGDQKISRRKTSSPVRFVGFNLGDYERSTTTRAGLKIEVCANRKLEQALQPKVRPMEVPPQLQPPFPRSGRRQQAPDMVFVPAPTPSPTARLQLLAGEIGAAVEEMTARFGKPPVQTLTVSPIPGRFGQGFPGLLYLSTLSYLSPAERPRTSPSDQVFFSELLHAHEVAHQWWGNAVTAAEYQDDWLMEGLANYSALWMLERKKGPKAVETILEQYRDNLLRKDNEGRTIESAGPLTLGHRLYSSQSPNAWSLITYQKSAWILHMLRSRMGEANFHKMLAELYRRYRYQSVTTEQFQALAQEFLPPKMVDPKLENFFDQWVNGTGIPTLKLKWTTTGRAPRMKLTGTLTQTDVDESFSTWVPVEVQVTRAKSIVHWVQSSSEPVHFELPLAAPPLKVTLDPANATLARK